MGSLASGLEGKGRMLEPEEIIEHIEIKLKETLPLSNFNFLITVGPIMKKLIQSDLLVIVPLEKWDIT